MRCSSIKKLKLHVQLEQINIPLLKHTFPNVQVLRLELNNTWHHEPTLFATPKFGTVGHI